MPSYRVEMRIDFEGVIEADSKEHAEQLAWTNWGDNSDAPITYESVYSIDVEEEIDYSEEEEPEGTLFPEGIYPGSEDSSDW